MLTIGGESFEGCLASSAAASVYVGLV
ncbi:hypothetical protein WG8_1384 [Paenibacillus sp. Aloe-11]|nr:hypothetical protein WG8_1384 [Paenibacillus sp. Aloe-11]